MSEPALKLYVYGGEAPGTTLSPPCGKAMMALRFKQRAFELVELTTPGQVARVNQRGRVPVLGWGDELICDSSDILTALDERIPDPPLLPANALARARCKILEDWADEVLYFYVVYLRWLVPENMQTFRERIFSRLPFPISWLAPILARREVRSRTRGQGVGTKPEAVVRRELDECLDALETCVGAGVPFLLGDAPTRADLSVAAIVDQIDTDFTPTARAALLRRDGIQAWRERVHQHMPNAAVAGA